MKIAVALLSADGRGGRRFRRCSRASERYLQHARPGPDGDLHMDGPQDDISPVLRERRRVQLLVGDEIPAALRRPAVARIADEDLVLRPAGFACISARAYQLHALPGSMQSEEQTEDRVRLDAGVRLSADVAARRMLAA